MIVNCGTLEGFIYGISPAGLGFVVVVGCTVTGANVMLDEEPLPNRFCPRFTRDDKSELVEDVEAGVDPPGVVVVVVGVLTTAFLLNSRYAATPATARPTIKPVLFFVAIVNRVLA